MVTAAVKMVERRRYGDNPAIKLWLKSSTTQGWDSTLLDLTQRTWNSIDVFIVNRSAIMWWIERQSLTISSSDSSCHRPPPAPISHKTTMHIFTPPLNIFISHILYGYTEHYEWWNIFSTMQLNKMCWKIRVWRFTFNFLLAFTFYTPDTFGWKMVRKI